MNRRTDGQTERRTDRQTDWQTDISIYRKACNFSFGYRWRFWDFRPKPEKTNLKNHHFLGSSNSSDKKRWLPALSTSSPFTAPHPSQIHNQLKIPRQYEDLVLGNSNVAAKMTWVSFQRLSVSEMSTKGNRSSARAFAIFDIDSLFLTAVFLQKFIILGRN